MNTLVWFCIVSKNHMSGVHGNAKDTRNKSYTVKKVIVFPVPKQDVTNQTLPGRELLYYSRPQRVWLVTFLLGTGKNFNLFYSVL
jgi:hypothetical protein